jgi:cyclin A
MRKLEQQLRPRANYISKQVDITTSMRSILVDWLVEVAEEYKLQPETLHLAVNYTDRFLSQMSVLRAKLQLVGTSCMYIASKYEEITPPEVAEFVYITDDTYTRKQVLRMEHLLLKTLDFRVSQPTANWFLTHFVKFMRLSNCLGGTGKQSDAFARFEFLARYLIELTLLDAETFLEYLPSQIAASAVYLSLLALKRPWTTQVAEVVGYEHQELSGCLRDLLAMHKSAGSLSQQAIQDKYKQSKYEHVSLIDPPAELP